MGSGLLLLDTSVLLHVIRGNEVARRIDAAWRLQTRPDRPLISIVTVGEARAFALRLGWGEEKLRRLEQLMQELVVVDIRNATVLDNYARFHTHLVRSGRTVGHNDIWIAATAAAASATLVTCDNDFDALHPDFIVRHLVPTNVQKASS